ncbi:MAG: universal stress protein [Flavobacteriaceae bacterium]
MATRRKKYDTENPRKFLVVIDDTPECERAVRYAAKRARSTRGRVVMLFVLVPGEFQHWLGVEDIMRAEAYEEAEKILAAYVAKIRDWCDESAEYIILEGQRADQIVQAIEDDPSIAILVLAAGTETEGPGPLVTTLAGRLSGTFPIPITVVPGNISDEDMDAVT